MGKAAIVVLLIGLGFGFGRIAEAQQQTKVAKVGWLGIRPASAGRHEVIRRTLREIGYVEGNNIAFEDRFADDNLDRLSALADELVRLKVDVLLAPSTPAALAAKNATRTIPIVFLNVADPVASGLVASLARPGGNITGFTTIETVLAGKRLELLKETVFRLSRVAVLWDPKNPGSTEEWKESQLPARELGLQLHSMEVASADKFEDAFQEAAKAHSVALAVTLRVEDIPGEDMEVATRAGVEVTQVATKDIMEIISGASMDH